MRFRLVSFLALSGMAASCGGSDSSSDQPPTPIGPDTTVDAGPAVVTPQSDYLIVAAGTLSASAERFKAYRASPAGGGHKVALSLVPSIVGGEKDAALAVTKIRDHVKAHYDVRDTQKPFFVLIVGDAVAGAPLDNAHVPSAQYFEPFDGSTVATDNLYADMDGDHIPDLAVGRFPLATDAEVDVVFEKTTRYESTYEVGNWNRRLNLFASTSGFGELIDAQIETLVFAIVEDIPYDYDITLTYAKQTSPYVYVPEKFSDMVYDRLNQGSLMMAYVGHGNTDSFADLVWNGQSFPILNTQHLGRIDAVHKPPLLTLIACLTGAFASGDSVSEQILRSKNGPVGVLSSTEISHPYPNAIFIRELAQGLATVGDATAGELFVGAKRRMVSTNDALRQSIDTQVAAFVGVDHQVALKRSHQYMYTLFGDPAARIAYPKAKAKVTAAAAHVAPGADVSVTATFAGLGKGQARVTLEVKRSTISGLIAAVPADGDATRDAVIAANYATANNRVIVEKTAAHDGAALAATTLTVPANAAPGDYYIKVYADDGKLDALGSTKITVP